MTTYRCPDTDCDFEIEEYERSSHFTCNGEEWVPMINEPVVPIDQRLIQARLQDVRVKQPEICWRPYADWTVVCILLLGHEGPCGWES